MKYCNFTEEFHSYGLMMRFFIIYGIYAFTYFMLAQGGMFACQAQDTLACSYIDSLANTLNTPKLANSKKIGVLFQMGIFYNEKGEYDKARFYLSKALEIPGAREHEGGRVIVNMANSYAFEGKYAEALKYYLEALEASEEHEAMGQNNIVRAMANISEVYYMIGNQNQALHYAKRANENIRQLVDSNIYIRPQVFYIIGSVSLDKGQLDLAEENMLKTYELADQICRSALQLYGNTRGMIIYKSYGMGGLAKIYLARKDYAKALEYATESFNYAEEQGDPVVLVEAYSTLSNIYREQKQYEESKNMVYKALATSTNAIKLKPELAFNAAVAYLFLGNKEKAYEFFRNYSDQMKENTDKNFRETIVGMEIQFETTKKELRISVLERQKFLYICIGVIGIVLSIALWMILRQKLKNAQKEKQLIATRSVLEGEMGERTRLSRDLHDRLSGNLSAVKIELNQVESLQNVCSKLDNCIEEIRRIAHDLMPVSLQFGMKVALEDFAAQYPNVFFHFFGEEKRIDERIEFIVYCCTNELINNAIKHSGAENINVQLIQDEKYISLTVQDDGCGFDESTVTKGMGLKNVYDRVVSCNGKIDIVTSPGKGTGITIELEPDKI
jgi:signal transduction histidine kinase